MTTPTSPNIQDAPEGIITGKYLWECSTCLQTGYNYESYAKARSDLATHTATTHTKRANFPISAADLCITLRDLEKLADAIVDYLGPDMQGKLWAQCYSSCRAAASAITEIISLQDLIDEDVPEVL